MIAVVVGVSSVDAVTRHSSQANGAGLATQAAEQGGVGLLMTVLIVSTPPMAAVFFNGTMGNFLYYPAFGMGGARGAAAMQTGLPPGAFGGRGYVPTVSQETPQGSRYNRPFSAAPVSAGQGDAIKSASQHVI